MAQRDKEETKFKIIETINHLCVNNCGISGNPSTKNMCQKCFESSSINLIQPPQTTSTTKTTSTSSIQSLKTPDLTSEILRSDDLNHDNDKPEEKPKKSVTREVNRCSGCRKKVGLTGFRCRCGDLFCPKHRYSDRHDCSYDYKAEGREMIARENPIVRPSKIIRL